MIDTVFRMRRKIILLFLYTLAAILFLTAIWLSRVNDHQLDGEATLDGLSNSVKVIRDDFGVPYIYALNLEDAIRAQGYVLAQDRLFQMEFARHLSQGRLAELLGEPGIKSDVLHRVVGLPYLGRQAVAALDEEQRRYVEAYVQGVNAYIDTQEDEFQLGLGIMSMKPQHWTVFDVLTLNYFINWGSSSNLESELIAQAIIDQVGPEIADQISQLSINPDVGVPVVPQPASGAGAAMVLDGPFGRPVAGAIELGSNSWAVSPAKSDSGAAILVNDPHIDARSLPGIWYPMGLITPEVRAVGVAGPGAAGLAVGRTDTVAWGITNSNGDVIDLYVETLDPEKENHYLEGKKSVPLEIREEVILVKGIKAGVFDEYKVTVRSTRRGPLISDHGITLDDRYAVSLRWSAHEVIGEDRGLVPLLLAKNIEELGQAVGGITAPHNYTAVDSAGNIAHFTAGRVPVRVRGDGSRPLKVADSRDAWRGMIPYGDMPGSRNPARGWVGNANNRTLPEDYPYQYSTHFAHQWRYERVRQLLDKPGKTSPEDHWQYMRDIKNTMAERMVPLMIKALSQDSETAWIAAELRNWDFRDDPDSRAPLLFQSVFRNFVWRTYVDDLGGELTERMLSNYYYWQDRIYLQMQDNEWELFDDRNTFRRETRDDLLRTAAVDTMVSLERRLGSNRDQWVWGSLHTVTFKSPIVPVKRAAAFLGGGTFPMEGSGETLNRAKFAFNAPFETTYIDSLRFVADMADPDKVLGVVPGGNSGRQFDPHLNDQLELWRSGELHYWWFSDAAISEHKVNTLMLVPSELDQT